MELRALSHNLKSKLDELQRETTEILEQTHKSIVLCRNVLLQFRKEISKKAFTSVKEEIDFFKSIKPEVLSKLLYFKEIYTIEINFPKVQKENQKKFIKKQLDRYEYFFSSHIDFGQYIEMNYTHFDDYYFTRKTNDQILVLPSFFHLEDPEFNTPGDTLLAQFKAYSNVVLYLHKKLATIFLDHQESFAKKNSLRWTGHKIDLIELIYALHSSGAVQNGESGINEIAIACEALFAVDLGNYYRKFLEIRNRKIDRTRFLDSLKSNLVQRMDDADN